MIEEKDTKERQFLNYDERRRCLIKTVSGLITLYFLNNSIHNLRVVIYQMEESTKNIRDIKSHDDSNPYTSRAKNAKGQYQGSYYLKEIY